jgi:tetratricopeptide (TPR) repeat protein
MSKDPLIENLERATLLEQQGNTAEAVRIARWIYDQNKSHAAAHPAALIWARAEGHNPDAIFALSSTFLLQGNFEQAIRGFRLVIQMDPKNAAAYGSVGICLQAFGDLGGVLEISQKGLAIDGKDFICHLSCSDALIEMGEMEAALEQTKKTIAIYPHNAGIHSNMARIYRALKNTEAALVHYKLAIQADPENPACHSNYALVLYQTGKTKELYKEILLVEKFMNEKPHFKQILPHAWQRVEYFKPLLENKVTRPHGHILHMHNMDEIGTTFPNFKVIDDTQPVWLFKIENMNCFAWDWAFYDDKNIFMNQQLTAQWNVFLLAHGIHNNAYVEDNFPRITIEEPGILLCGTTNYYHWMIDTLPRLEILKTHPELKDLPIYMNNDVKPFQKESLALMGIAEDRIKTVPGNHVLVLKNMYLPYIPGRPMQEDAQPDWMKPNKNPFIPQWLRQNFLDKISKTTPKRYFMSRANAEFRRCLNEDEIFAIAQEYGFEKMANEGKSFIDQVAIYASAEAVIGPHGAGFTNMVFSPPDAKMFELIPKGRKLPFFEAIAEELGQTYLSIEGPILRTFNDKSSDFGDFWIDPNLFRTMMQQNF